MSSYIEQHYPDQFNALGGGFTKQHYKKHISDSFNLASMLNALLYTSAEIWLTGDNDKTTSFSPFFIDREDIKKKNVSYLKTYLVLPILLGRKRCLVSHKQDTVEWFVQKINYSIDKATGEIDDRLALSYKDDVRAAGYPCELYYIDSDVLGCLVITGQKTHQEAQKISKSFASQYVQIRADFNSLVKSAPLPLSINRSGSVCSFYEAGGSDESILDRLTSQLPKSPLSRPRNTEEINATETRPAIKTDWIVELSFRNQLVNVVGDDPEMLKLVGLALFSTFRDGDYAVIDKATMTQIHGKSLGKTDTISYFLKLLDDKIPIIKKSHSWLLNKATSFKIISPKPYMIEMVKNIDYPKQCPVLLSSGKQIDSSSISFDTRESCYPNEVSTDLLEYLNNLPANTFTTRMYKHLDEMINVAEMLEEESRDKALKNLAHIQAYPKPIYRYAPYTTRIYAAKGHYQQLKREIRDIAFKDCIKLDLAYSQLAISSRLFQCSEMIKLCESENVWSYIQNITHLEKHQIKSYIYSLLFQDDESILKETSLEMIDVEKILLNSPEFKSFYDSRTLFLKSNLNFTYTDCFNNPLIGGKNNKLSALLQSYELFLFKPALDYFYNLKDNRTKIVLYLFDGFYLSGSKRECLNVANQMVKIVKKNANDLRIPTRLTIESFHS